MADLTRLKYSSTSYVLQGPATQSQFELKPSSGSHENSELLVLPCICMLSCEVFTQEVTVQDMFKEFMIHAMLIQRLFDLP